MRRRDLVGFLRGASCMVSSSTRLLTTCMRCIKQPQRNLVRFLQGSSWLRHHLATYYLHALHKTAPTRLRRDSSRLKLAQAPPSYLLPACCCIKQPQRDWLLATSMRCIKQQWRDLVGFLQSPSWLRHHLATYYPHALHKTAATRTWWGSIEAWAGSSATWLLSTCMRCIKQPQWDLVGFFKAEAGSGTT